MIHPHTELRFISEQMGFGVFATQFIPKGTIIWALDELDQILEADYLDTVDKNKGELIKKYAYRNQDGKFVLCWDLGKYVNHSFHANCMGTAYEFEIAIRDINPGEQLTDDYGTLNIDEPFECISEEGTERKLVYPDDLLTYYEKWDQQVLSALQHVHDVEQQLFHLVRPEFIEKINTAATEQLLGDSIKTIYYNRNI